MNHLIIVSPALFSNQPNLRNNCKSFVTEGIYRQAFKVNEPTMILMLNDIEALKTLDIKPEDNVVIGVNLDKIYDNKAGYISTLPQECIETLCELTNLLKTLDLKIKNPVTLIYE